MHAFSIRLPSKIMCRLENQRRGGTGRTSNVNCRMACCTMCNVLVSITKLPNDPLTDDIWWFNHRTKYSTHRTTSHLTVEIWRVFLCPPRDSSKTHGSVKIEHQPARLSPPEFSVLLCRAAHIPCGHLDANRRSIVAGLSSHWVGGAIGPG